MTRRADPLRIEAARRAAAIARLISAGHRPETASRLVADWLAGLGRVPLREDWEALDAWVAGPGAGQGSRGSRGVGTGQSRL
jgi:hypothetical protein